MKHLLKMLDLSTEEIIEILDLADQLKYELKHGIPHPHLKGKSLGMIFQKASTVPVFLLKPACTSWADTRCSCPQMICRSAEANRCRILPAFCPAIWTAS